MLIGAGQLFVQTLGLGSTSLRGENLINPLCIASFELTPNDSLAEAKCLINGRKQIKASAITETIYSLKLSFEFVDWATIQLAFDELSTTGNAVLPILKSAVVDSSNEIADADLTGAAGTYVYAPATGTYYKVLSSGTPTAGQVVVDGDGLTFPTGSAGTQIQYSYNHTYTGIQSIGAASSYDKFGALAFSGVISGTEFSNGMQVICPRIYRVSSPTLSITGDLAKLDIEFRCAVADGERTAFKLYKLA